MSIKQTFSEVKILAIVVTLLILSHLLIIAKVMYAQSTEYTYAIAVVSVRAGIRISSGTFKIEAPKHLLVNRNNTLKVYFERSGDSNDVIVIFTIGARINTAGGSKEYSLQTVSFPLKGDVSQQALIDFNVPEELYRQSTDKKVKVFVKGMVCSPMYINTFIDTCNIGENIPAEAYLVYGVPQPQLSVRGLGLGYVNMTVGEVRSIFIDVNAMYAPILVRSVDISTPPFVAVYINTPLPLNVGVNESIPIAISVKGVQPGAGVIDVAIRYYTGVDERYITIYIPVVVEEKHIFELINQYRYELQQLLQDVENLETQLNIRISDIHDLTQRLTTIFNTLVNLERQYSEALNKIDIASSKTSQLSNSITSLTQQLNQVNIEIANQKTTLETLNRYTNSLSQQIQQLTQQINQIENTINNLSSSVKDIRGYIDEQDTSIKELQQVIDRNTILVLGITGISIATLILVIRIIKGRY